MTAHLLLGMLTKKLQLREEVKEKYETQLKTKEKSTRPRNGWGK